MITTKRDLIQALRGLPGNTPVYLAIGGNVEAIHDIFIENIQEEKTLTALKASWLGRMLYKLIHCMYPTQKQAIIAADNDEVVVLLDESGKFTTIKLHY